MVKLISPPTFILVLFFHFVTLSVTYPVILHLRVTVKRILQIVFYWRLVVVTSPHLVEIYLLVELLLLLVVGLVHELRSIVLLAVGFKLV